ncbi:MAG: nucleotidyl transferase AbiEii/AbiGii toxin family protein [Christensenellaceae bacterium]|jgi:predicted nucleotidyltransferase component of viral defense system|nr:nucleotidyl transferase AbiEii/AbiGii toxin family protein [Christensenellaceae bacterium]
MLLPPVKNILDLAKKTGFTQDGIEKIMRIADLLEYIGASPWNKKFVIKGDAAFHMFYTDCMRLFNEIDIDYTSDSRSYKESDRDNIRNLLVKSIAVKGYVCVKQPNNDDYDITDSFTFAYTSLTRQKDTIKLNINYFNGELLLNYDKLKLNNSIVKTSMPLNVMNINELISSKIAAILDKARPLELYDIYSVIHSQIKLNNTFLRKCSLFYSCVWNHGNITGNDTTALDKIVKASVTKSLKPLLKLNDKFDFTVAIMEVKKYLTTLLVFNASEEQFVSSYLKKDYQPDLLFDETDILVKIKDHPMAILKVTL